MIVSISDAGGYGNKIEDVTIRNNIFTANNHAGLVLQGMTHDVKVYHNTFYQNGILGIYVEGDPKLSGVDIRNNLIYQTPNSNCSAECNVSPQPHVLVGAAARDVTLASNFYYPAPTLGSDFKDASAVTGNIHFVNAAALDFHIKPPSITIDHGVSLAAVATDYDGKKRPQGAGDYIGAFEN